MIKVVIEYTDGSSTEHDFESDEALYWFIRMEGDHVLNVRHI